MFNNRSEDHAVAADSSVALVDLDRGESAELVSAKSYGGVSRHSGGHAVLDDWVLMSLSL